jgi:hypothetical protein
VWHPGSRQPTRQSHLKIIYYLRHVKYYSSMVGDVLKLEGAAGHRQSYHNARTVLLQMLRVDKMMREITEFGVESFGD